MSTALFSAQLLRTFDSEGIPGRPMRISLNSPSSFTSTAQVLNFCHKILSSPTSMCSQAVSASITPGEGAQPSEIEISSSSMIGEYDLLIVGPGVLGRLVAEAWAEKHPGCQIFGQTMTTDHHEELLQLGIHPSLRGSKADLKFPYIIFCAPPSRTPDYSGDVRLAASKWNGRGSLLFTSSSGLYDCHDNGPCDEESAIMPLGRSHRMDIFLEAEHAMLEFQGCVLRLAGLYKADRGPHTYWLEKGSVEARPDHIINLIHYEDAASLSVLILEKKLMGRVFLGCDNHPLSRQEVMDLINRSGKFRKTFKGFQGVYGPLGKKLDNSKTRAAIGWEPKYPSLSAFLRGL